MKIQFAILFAFGALLAGCEDARITVGISDAPIDEASRVIIAIESVNVKPVAGSVERFDFDPPLAIDLLTLQGNTSQLLLDGEEVDEGDYEYLELKIDADEDELDSFVEFRDGRQISLQIVGSDTIRANVKFTVEERGTEELTIDFDLRRSINTDLLDADGVLETDDDTPNISLRPTLRAVRNSDAGAIRGTVSSARIMAADCSSALSADEGVGAGNAVYLFAGNDITAADLGNTPAAVSSSLVRFNASTGEYEFEIGFVNQGDYTLAFTCDALLDQPDQIDDDVEFDAGVNVEVVEEQTTTVTL